MLISTVLDLPQLHEKPAATVLMKALASLEIKPRSWKRRASDAKQSAGEIKGLSRYLTSIIASPLAWFEDDDSREQIWEEASARLSERSGRTAAKSIDREFEIPVGKTSLNLVIHEPALTSDNLGCKTWAASYVLAKRFGQMKLPRHLNALELGSGTGLVGMAAAAVLGWNVVLTDLPEIQPNLSKNVEQNKNSIFQNDGNAFAGVLDWSVPQSLELVAGLDQKAPPKYPVILAADVVYSAEHPAMLANVLVQWLERSPSARFILEIPRRTGFESEQELLKAEMAKAGLTMVEEDEDMGYDDWGSEEFDEQAQIKCWYSVWAWK